MNISNEWASVVARIVHESKNTIPNNSGGIAIVTAHIVVDSTGKPLFWVVPEGKRVEPSKDAKQHLIDVLSS